MKKWYVIVIVLALGLVSFIFLKQNSSKQTTQQPTKQTIEAFVTASGNVEALGKLDIFANSNGVIEELYVKNGDIVKPGQKLFKVKSTSSEQDKAKAYANYLAAVASLKSAEQSSVSLQSDFQSAESSLRSAQAKEQTVVSGDAENRTNPSTAREYTQEEVKQAKSGVEAARVYKDSLVEKKKQIESSIQSSRSLVNSSWLDYQSVLSNIVTASVAGTVSNLSRSVSDKVEVKRTPAQGETAPDPVLIISNKETQYVYIDITELKISKVKENQKAKIRLDAFPGKEFTGKVIHVDDIGKPLQGVTSFKVLVSFDDSKEAREIRSGMSATVTIETDKRENVLSLPNSSIYQRDGMYYVKSVVSGKEEEKKVEVGIKGDVNSEILSGISESDSILISK